MDDAFKNKLRDLIAAWRKPVVGWGGSAEAEAHSSTQEDTMRSLADSLEELLDEDAK